MRRYRYNYQSILYFEVPVERHDFYLRCLPCENACQHIVAEELHIRPASHILQGMDGQKNRIQYGYTNEQHDAFVFTCNGEVELSAYRLPASGNGGLYRVESRLTLSGPRLEALSQSLLFPDGLSVADKALQIADAVHHAMTYMPQSTDNQTSAEEALTRGQGVCQDYAHICIALCRRKGIAARYVNGFVVGTGVTHAWIEVLIDEGAWIGIDPTANRAATEGYIKIAHGRDAADCPVNRGIFRGAPTGQKAEIRVIVEPIEYPQANPFIPTTYIQ